IDLAVAGSDPESLAGVEAAFSASAVRFAQHVHSGRIAPRRVSSYFDMAPKPADAAGLLIELAAADDPAVVIAGLEPQHEEFQELKAALAGFEDGSAEEIVTIPDGPLLRAGTVDPRVPLLRQRLGLAMPAS